MTERNDHDDQYSGNRNSGIFRLRLKDSTPEIFFENNERNLMAMEIMRMNDVYRRRAEVRNSFRSWIERSRLLCRIFGVPFIEQTTPRQIAFEEELLRESRIRRLAGEEKDVHPVKTLAEAARAPTFDEVLIRRGEHAKYIGTKANAYVAAKNFRKARSFVPDPLERARHPEDCAAVDEVLELVAVKGLEGVLQTGDAAHAAEAFMELGAMKLFLRTDLYGVPQENLEDPEMKGAFIRHLAALMGKNPALYVKVNNQLEETGIINPGEAGGSPEVHESMKKFLASALTKNERLFIDFMRILNEAGIVNADEFVGSEEMQGIFVAALVKIAAVSPDIYAFMRDRWADKGLIDAKKMNENPAIRKEISWQLLRRQAVHPDLCVKCRFLWGQKGMFPLDEDDVLLLENDGKVKSRNMDGSFLQELMKNMALRLYENERKRVAMLIQAYNHFDEKKYSDAKASYAREYYEFHDSYPQFRGLPESGEK